MSRGEALNPVAAESGNSTERANLSLSLITELSNASLGYSVRESASDQLIAENGVKLRRRQINQILGTRNTRHSIVEGIQQGYVPIDIDETSVEVHFSPTQRTILQLAACGFYVEEIAKKCTISRHTVNSQFENIRQQLGALNINHAMRRAFEAGIFKIGERILDPVEQMEQRLQNLQIAVGGVMLKASEIGVTNTIELEFLFSLGKVKEGYFTPTSFYDIGFLESADSDTSRSHALGRAVSSTSAKLEQAYGSKVIERVGNNGKSRRYLIRTPLSIGTPDGMVDIPAFVNDGAIPLRHKTKKNTSPEPGSMKRKATKAQTTKSVVNDKNTSTYDIDRDYLEPSSLPEINAEFLSNLQARDPKEVLENPAVITAIDAIIRQGLLFDYRPRVVVPLRYGLIPNVSKIPIVIKRNGTYLRLQEIKDYVPPYQGLDIESTSQILGFQPAAILRVEESLINLYGKKYPALQGLRPYIKKQILAARIA